MEIDNRQIERMQELENIRACQSKNTDPVVKTVNKEPFCEFKWHEEMQAKVDAYEAENGKQFYTQNR